MQLAEIGILTPVTCDVLAALSLKEGARVPPGVPRGGRGVRDDVAVDPDYGISPLYLQHGGAKRHSLDLDDVPLRD